jgi:hypothetical protein
MLKASHDIVSLTTLYQAIFTWQKHNIIKGQVSENMFNDKSICEKKGKQQRFSHSNS